VSRRGEGVGRKGGGRREEGGGRRALKFASQKTLAIPETDPETVFSLKELQAGTPEGVDRSRKEEYLSCVEFQATFGMPLAEFGKLPNWKKSAEKKRVGLF
jgi:hypothetical protein